VCSIQPGDFRQLILGDSFLLTEFLDVRADPEIDVLQCPRVESYAPCLHPALKQVTGVWYMNRASLSFLSCAGRTRGVALRSRDAVLTAINLLLALSCAVAQGTVTTVSTADYVGYPLAPNSIVSLFATNIATGTFSSQNTSPNPLPTSLGGVSATITDASGKAAPISLIAVTPGQVNAVLPSGLLAGAAVVNLTTSGGSHLSGSVTIAAVAPSLFTADESGGWLAAAVLLIAHADGSQTVVGPIATCGTALVWNGATWSHCVPVPINLGSATDQAVLELYGTGLRGADGVVQVSAGQCISGQCNYLPVLYAGPQAAGAPGSFYGLDQVNLSLPHWLTGSGTLTLSLSALSGYSTNGVGIGANANQVSVYIQ
jgi:uncharacterized protein (TIGR03437 family)